MKNTTLLILLSLFIISCDKKGDVVEEKYTNGQKKLVVNYGEDEEILKKIEYHENGQISRIRNYYHKNFPIHIIQD